MMPSSLRIRLNRNKRKEICNILSEILFSNGWGWCTSLFAATLLYDFSYILRTPNRFKNIPFRPIRDVYHIVYLIDREDPDGNICWSLVYFDVYNHNERNVHLKSVESISKELRYIKNINCLDYIDVKKPLLLDLKNQMVEEGFVIDHVTLEDNICFKPGENMSQMLLEYLIKYGLKYPIHQYRIYNRNMFRKMERNKERVLKNVMFKYQQEDPDNYQEMAENITLPLFLVQEKKHVPKCDIMVDKFDKMISMLDLGLYSYITQNGEL